MSSFSTLNQCRSGNPGQEAKIRALLAWHFSVDAASIDVQDNIVEDLYADSLELLDMCLSLNTTFDIEIGPQELATMEVVGDVYRVVARLRRTVEKTEQLLPVLAEEEFVCRLAAVRSLK